MHFEIQKQKHGQQAVKYIYKNNITFRRIYLLDLNVTSQRTNSLRRNNSKFLFVRGGRDI